VRWVQTARVILPTARPAHSAERLVPFSVLRWFPPPTGSGRGRDLVAWGIFIVGHVAHRTNGARPVNANNRTQPLGSSFAAGPHRVRYDTRTGLRIANRLSSRGDTNYCKKCPAMFTKRKTMMRGDLRHVMKRHAKDKQGNADTHCDEPSVRLCIHGLHHPNI